jgi:hypothetical protein
MKVSRSREVYASWDGKDTLSIAAREDFDADDSLGQMIFHEICHALVAGHGKVRPDWGLSNTDDADLVFEHACHRVQAALAAPHGLRDFMAVTTQWRPYWDALPADPLAPCDDPAQSIAVEAYARAQRPPYQKVLQDALTATAALAALVAPYGSAGSLWATVHPKHSTGFLANADSTLRCGQCAWAFSARPGGALRCRQSEREGRQASWVAPDETACERWEPVFGEAECRTCGACCREGFDLVQVGLREPFARAHPSLVQRSSLGASVPRPGGRCVALDGDGVQAPFTCRYYEIRPKSCAQFPIGGAACLLARRRTGLSR